MRYLLILLLINVQSASAQLAGRDIALTYRAAAKVTDSTWERWTVKEKIDYCQQVAEQYMQLGGRVPAYVKRNISRYIYTNTQHLHRFGEYTCSERQYRFFKQYADSVTFYFRKALFKDGADLFYWHNIVLAMKPVWKLLQVMVDYIAYRPSQKVNVLALGYQLMERDSFPDLLESDMYAKLQKQNRFEARLPANTENSAALLSLLKDYCWELYRDEEGGSWDWRATDLEIIQRLEKEDTVYAKTGKLSDKCFDRLNARELLAYCRMKPELYTQICALMTDSRDHQKYLYETGNPNGMSESDFSQRQKRALLSKRDSCAGLLASFLSKDPYDEERFPANLLELTEAWEAIPYLVMAHDMYSFSSRRYLVLLRKLMRLADYQPYLDFVKEENLKLPAGSSATAVLKTPENEQKIVQLARSYYSSKLSQ